MFSVEKDRGDLQGFFSSVNKAPNPISMYKTQLSAVGWWTLANTKIRDTELQTQVVTKAQNLITDVQVSATAARQVISTDYCCDSQIMDDIIAGARAIRVQQNKFIQDC